ncbi:MAG TPA: hypothetical protein VFL80_13260 [Thermoanaerobaculia bacterium]|nr:hypothetical protein [Thermoanaerobaculia bacterium]
MNGSRRFLTILFFSIIALPAAAQVNDTYVIPAIGNAPGAFGTRWATQLSVFNPQLDYSLKVSVVFLPTGGGPGIEALLTVPPNGSWYTTNAMADIFGITGSGSLLVATFPEDNPGVPNDVVSRSFHVITNTYNNSAAGTFGQTVPGIWTGLQDFASDGISAVAHGIRHISRLGWRTNIGAVNLGRSSVTMRLTIYDEDGRTVAKNLPFTIPPLGHIQDRLPVEVDRGSVEFFIDDPSRDAVVFPYTSTIDQYSGDPAYQSPTLLASANILYSKGGVHPTAIGKKIDNSFARGVRATAMRVGEIPSTMRVGNLEGRREQ